MTHAEEIRHCEEAARRYENGEYRRYDDEMGWEEWMEAHTNGDNPIFADIIKVEVIAWNNIHPSDKVDAHDEIMRAC